MSSFPSIMNDRGWSLALLGATLCVLVLGQSLLLGQSLALHLAAPALIVLVAALASPSPLYARARPSILLAADCLRLGLRWLSVSGAPPTPYELRLALIAPAILQVAYALPFPWFIPRALLLLLGEFLAAPANLAAAPAHMIASCLALPLALAVVRPSEARTQPAGEQGPDAKGNGAAGRTPYRAEFRRKGRGFGAKLVGVHPRDLTDEDREAFVRVLRKNLAAKGLGEEVRVALAMHEGCIQLNARYWVLGPNNELTPVDVGVDVSEVINALPNYTRNRVTHALINNAEARGNFPHLLTMEPQALPCGRGDLRFRARVRSGLGLEELEKNWQPVVGLSQTFERLLPREVAWQVVPGSEASDPSDPTRTFILDVVCPCDTTMPQLLHLALEGKEGADAAAAAAASSAASLAASASASGPSFAPSAPPAPADTPVIISNTIGVPLLPSDVIEELASLEEMLDDVVALLDLSATPARRPSEETDEYLGVCRRMRRYAAVNGLSTTEVWLGHFLEPEIMRYCGRPPPMGGNVSLEAARLATTLQGTSPSFLAALRLSNRLRRHLGLLDPVPKWLDRMATKCRAAHVLSPILLGALLSRPALNRLGPLIPEAIVRAAAAHGPDAVGPWAAAPLAVIAVALPALHIAAPDQLGRYQWAAAGAARALVVALWGPGSLALSARAVAAQLSSPLGSSPTLLLPVLALSAIHPLHVALRMPLMYDAVLAGADVAVAAAASAACTAAHCPAVPLLLAARVAAHAANLAVSYAMEDAAVLATDPKERIIRARGKLSKGAAAAAIARGHRGSKHFEHATAVAGALGGGWGWSPDSTAQGSPRAEGGLAAAGGSGGLNPSGFKKTQ